MNTAAKKTVYIILAVILFSTAQIFFCGCGYTKSEEKTLRVCVTADSPSQSGQSVRSDVSAAVGYYLDSELDGVKSYDAAYRRVRERLGTVSALASAVVRKRGGGYSAEVTLKENSAARGSELIIKLGTGSGGNVSVVAYPQASVRQDVVVYESVLIDLAKKFLREEK